MRILALDLATHTGWAAWDGRLVASGVQCFPLWRGESCGMQLLRFRGWLRKVCAEVRPDLIAHEQSIVGAKANKLAIDMEALIRTECAAAKIETTSVPVSTLKKHATGKGNASKGLMTEAAIRRWGVEIEDDNHADALCVLAWALDEVGEVPQ